MLEMRLNFWSGDLNIIQINENEVEALQNPIHLSLKNLSGVFLAKRHPHKFKESKRSCNCPLGIVLRGHWDLMKTPN